MEIYDINEREFKIAVLEILNQMRENIDRRFSQLIKQLSKQNEYVTKDVETLKKNQTEILDMENSIKEMKNEVVSIGNGIKQIQERISDIEDKNLEMMQREEKRNLNIKKKMKELYENYLVPSEKAI